MGGKGKERRGKEKGRLIVCKMCNGGGGPENWWNLWKTKRERTKKKTKQKLLHTDSNFSYTSALLCLALPLPLIDCYIHFYLLIIIPSFLNYSGPITLLSSHSFCPITSCQLVLTVAITYDVFGCITELEVELIAENSSPADQRVFIFYFFI